MWSKALGLLSGYFNYIKIAAGILGILGCIYVGWYIRDLDFKAYKAEQAAQTQKLQDQHQAAANQIEKDKNAQIKAINDQLADALMQLRSRPSRTETTATRSGGTGSTLYAEDAGFLIREAARADEIRVGLEACYSQYDAVSK